MSNSFIGRGNLGADPEIRDLPGDDDAVVCALRVYFDRQKPDDNGDFHDKGGYWMDVSYFGKRAEHTARLLRKGARVAVTGELLEETWKDRESGEDRSKLAVRASHIDLDLFRVDNIDWRPRSDKAA